VQGSAEVEVDVDLLVDLDHEGAGIFETPLDVGDDEGAYRVDLLAVDLHLHGHVDLVGGADEGEDTVNLEGGVAVGVEGSSEAGGGEGDGLEFGGFELVIDHAAVAVGVAAFSAEGVDEDGAVGLAGGGIEGYFSLLDAKSSADGVEFVVEGEVDFAAVGVEGELCWRFVLRVQEHGGGDEEENVANLASMGGESGRRGGETKAANVHEVPQWCMTRISGYSFRGRARLMKEEGFCGLGSSEAGAG
jgi:hypothetical protein